jgi:hypothetical protein
MSDLRQSIGGFRNGGKLLNTTEALAALIKRVDELEADQFSMIGALQGLGMDRCQSTEEWHKVHDLIYGGDRCQCVRSFDPDFFFDENDEENDGFDRLVDVFRQITSKGHNNLMLRFPRTDGVLDEPYFSAYQKATALRGGGR